MSKTFYYRAAYFIDGKTQHEVFISDTMEHAYEYAEDQRDGRELIDVKEYTNLNDAWTIDGD